MALLNLKAWLVNLAGAAMAIVIATATRIYRRWQNTKLEKGEAVGRSRPLGSSICSMESLGDMECLTLNLGDVVPEMRNVDGLLTAKTVSSIEEWKFSKKEIFAMVKLVFQGRISLSIYSNIW
jgi:hypothetical protein